MTATLFWFRKGLRLHDNPALLATIAEAHTLYPVFVIDPALVTPERVGANRLAFLLESLAALDSSLRRLGSRLIVLRGEPVACIARALAEWQIARLGFERDDEPYARQRDRQIVQIATERGIAVRTLPGHTLYDPAASIAAAGGRAPRTYQAFLKLLAQLGPPAAPCPAPGALPPLGPLAGAIPRAIPSLAELGHPSATATLHAGAGGEGAALERLSAWLADRPRVAHFAKPDTDPTAFAPPSTTTLSPYLKFGCLSPRTFWSALQQIYAEFPDRTQPPVSLLGQLYWREFFYTLAWETPNYDRMVGNPICRQIPWEDDPARLAAWEEGRTGYPWIDAAMIQLRQEGWLHHLARHAVACFLTRGDLWVSWEAGQRVFERWLVDADWCLNASNWMWLSASAFFHAYHRVYSPVAFARRTDPGGQYVRHFLPGLARLPDRYIYEPWKAPLAVQREAGCLIGRDYPAPIVDHDQARVRNLERMRSAYAAG